MTRLRAGRATSAAVVCAAACVGWWTLTAGNAPGSPPAAQEARPRTPAVVPSPTAAAPAAPPRLVVVLSVDQMRGDYIERYGHQWTRGLKQLVERGAWFRQAGYPYMNTATCPGHATIATGTLPATHGMVLNGWWDRSEQRMRTCTADDDALTLAAKGATKGGHGPDRLLVTTLADELRAQRWPTPRVVSLSLKPRSAITLAGHRADLALWWAGASGFVTSSAFAAARDPEMDRWLREHRIEADVGKTWERSLPAAAYLFEDAGLGEVKAGWTATFPHPMTGGSAAPDESFYALWEASPFSDEYLGRLAARAVERYGLGGTERTDYLAVSFSALDVVGHAFGPRSHEVQDMLVRLDATIGRLLDVLDRRVGRDRYVVALTGDHGVAPVPEQMADMGAHAGRILLGTDDAADLNTRIAKHLGPGHHVAALVYTDLYLATGAFERLRAMPGALEEIVAAIERTPGVARVLRRDDVVAGRLPPGEPLARAVALGYHPERSGDLILIPRPYWIISNAATTHGTGYRYDARVPVILAGPGIRPGQYPDAASPADIAPTLAFLAGVTMPRTDGRVLAEALIVQGPPSRPDRRRAVLPVP